MMKKAISIFLVCMLVILSSVVPISATVVSKMTSHPLTTGNILYVGGSGPNNYTRIQDAINVASPSDTVYVYDDSSPYHETLKIFKPIILVGENKETTVIEATTENTTVVTITANNVSMSGFTILMSPSTGWNMGIRISKMEDWPGETEIIRDVHIFNNNIEAATDLSAGIDCLYLNYGNISNNYVNCGYDGIILFLSSHNTITKNVVEHSHWGIYVQNTWNPRYHLWLIHPKFGDNIISGNTVRNNQIGILIDGDRTTNDKILENNITDNELGIVLCTSLKTEIARNNFIGNNLSASIETINLFFYPTNSWHDNYWGEPKKLPVPIFGRFWFIIMFNTDFRETNFGSAIPLGKYPVIAFDRKPAQEPYDIPAGV
jgi:parallel beta-helix repeat protein